MPLNSIQYQSINKLTFAKGLCDENNRPHDPNDDGESLKDKK